MEFIGHQTQQLYIQQLLQKTFVQYYHYMVPSKQQYEVKLK